MVSVVLAEDGGHEVGRNQRDSGGEAVAGFLQAALEVEDGEAGELIVRVDPQEDAFFGLDAGGFARVAKSDVKDASGGVIVHGYSLGLSHSSASLMLLEPSWT